MTAVTHLSGLEGIRNDIELDLSTIASLQQSAT
jgi:hypothetical protein